jgi:hypothetical protein
MISLLVNGKFFNLPEDQNCRVNPTRDTASRTAQLGNVVRQVSPLHVSRAITKYSGTISAADAELLRDAHWSTSTAFLTTGGHCYETTFSLDRSIPSGVFGMERVELTFYPVREVA